VKTRALPATEDAPARSVAAGSAAEGHSGQAAIKPPVPRWRWALWFAVLAPALVVFYVLLTPVWVGIRVTRWLSARRGSPVPDN
jgi:hypothetical protein